MAELVFLVHGWSVTSTKTYGSLHVQLAKNGFELKDIYLGRYVSLEDRVEIRDISKALQKALTKHLGTNWTKPFHIITHSTGALVVKHWIIHHYTGRFAAGKPLKNLVFLAGPHFGSRLAHHGRSILAQIAYFGDTGDEVLRSLELASEFSWDIATKWLDNKNWKSKGIRPFNLIGDRVDKNIFKSRLFPAAYEKGSDMVVRAAAGNLNFKRFAVGPKGISPIGEVQGIPFGALSEYTHSGTHGIMKSIKKNSTVKNHLALRLIVGCLRVKTAAEYKQVGQLLARQTKLTRAKRKAYSQLEFRFTDETDAPVNDYLIQLGAIVKNKRKHTHTIVHRHKNKISPNHFVGFIRMDRLEPKYAYFMSLDSKSHSDLFSYVPDPLEITANSPTITNIVVTDQTTQIDVTLTRETSSNLFVFHRGDDPKLPVSWNRKGKID